PIPLQPQTVAGVRPRRVRLGIIEITGENQVEITIAVHIVGDDSSDGRDLREVRQNMRAEPASSFVAEINAGESVDCVMQRLLQSRLPECLAHAHFGEGSVRRKYY